MPVAIKTHETSIVYQPRNTDSGYCRKVLHRAKIKSFTVQADAGLSRTLVTSAGYSTAIFPSRIGIAAITLSISLNIYDWGDLDTVRHANWLSIGNRISCKRGRCSQKHPCGDCKPFFWAGVVFSTLILDAQAWIPVMWAGILPQMRW